MPWHRHIGDDVKEPVFEPNSTSGPGENVRGQSSRRYRNAPPTRVGGGSVTTSKSRQFRSSGEAIDRGVVPLDEVKAGGNNVSAALEDERSSIRTDRKYRGRVARPARAGWRSPARKGNHALRFNTNASRRCARLPAEAAPPAAELPSLQLRCRSCKPEAEAVARDRPASRQTVDAKVPPASQLHRWTSTPAIEKISESEARSRSAGMVVAICAPERIDFNGEDSTISSSRSSTR